MNSYRENNHISEYEKLIKFNTLDNKQYWYNLTFNQDYISFNIYDNDPHSWLGSIDVYQNKYTFYGRGFSGGCNDARLDPTNRAAILELAINLMTFR